MKNAEPAVLRNLRRSFDRPALDGLSLSVRPGEAYALLGRNGAGKTTALRILVGADPDYEGTATILGEESRSLSLATRARIGVVMEGQALFETLTIAEHLAYASPFYPRWDHAYARTLQDRLGLDPGQRVSTLSRGSRAKVGLLLAAPYRPDLLVLDDISGGLDVATRRDLLESIVETLTEEGRSVLFSSHILTEVERVADRIGILAGGKLVAEGTPDEVRASIHPAEVPMNLEDVFLEYTRADEATKRGVR